LHLVGPVSYLGYCPVRRVSGKRERVREVVMDCRVSCLTHHQVTLANELLNKPLYLLVHSLELVHRARNGSRGVTEMLPSNSHKEELVAKALVHRGCPR